MKIVFIHKLESFMAPIGILQMAAIAKELGHKVEYVNINQPGWHIYVDVAQPQIVAASVMTGEAKHYYGAAALLKRTVSDALLVAGGHHPTFFPEMAKESAFHVICRGEGEAAFKTLLQDVERGKQLQGYDSIPNLVTATTHDPMSIPMYPLEHCLDSLPPPLWELIYDNTHLGNNPLKIYMTGRGCPFSCGYCTAASWRALYPGQHASTLRKYSVDYIIEDLLRIKTRWPLEYVKFYDDVFVTRSDEWFLSFCREYRRSIGKPFFVLMRAEHLTDEIADFLKWAGCQCISMSIESTEGVRRIIMNRSQSDEALIDAHALCRKYGIHTFTNVMVGLPDTTVTDDLAALELAVKCEPTWQESPIFEPYPRTHLGSYTFSKGYADQDWRQIHTSYQYRSRLSCFTETEKDTQQNFGTLGVLAVLYPRFRKWITTDLIYRKPRKLYLLLYFVVKMRVLQTKIYPTGLSWWGRMKVYYRSLKQEFWRHTDET